MVSRSMAATREGRHDRIPTPAGQASAAGLESSAHEPPKYAVACRNWLKQIILGGADMQMVGVIEYEYSVLARKCPSEIKHPCP